MREIAGPFCFPAVGLLGGAYLEAYNLFAQEFDRLMVELENILIEEVILNSPKGEKINKVIVEDLGSMVLFQPSREYLDKIKMDNDE